MLMSQSFLSSALGLLASTVLVHRAAAQVTTSCNPLNTTNCPSDPAFGASHNFVFNATPAAETWETTAGSVAYDPAKGATFTINKQGDSPTIRSKFYIFFGRVEIIMKAAPGTGIISSVMLLSDDLDEIDWEFMGGNTTHAETNYFGKGAQDFHNAIYYPVNNGVQSDYHNYTINWTQDQLEYWIDGGMVRTLLAKDANNTLNYPQTPMRISLGIWAGGDPTLPEGTRQWAGGDTNYKAGPFTMYVKSAAITDASQGKTYSYGDMTGSYSSIRIASGNSTAKTTVENPPQPEQSVSDKWNALPSGTKIGIYAAAGGVAGLFFCWALYYCIRQRRRGAREAAIAEEKAAAERAELERFKKAGVDPDSFAEQGGVDYYAPGTEKLPPSTSASSMPPTSSHGWEAGLGAGAAAGAGLGAGAMAARNGSNHNLNANDNANGMRSPMPLLRDGAQSPRVASPAIERDPYAGGAYDRRSPTSPVNSLGRDHGQGGLISPVRTQSPGLNLGGVGGQPQGSPRGYAASPNGPGMLGPQSRSFSTPNAPMRVASPAQEYGPGMQRTQSPGMMPQPQRSFTGYSQYQQQSQQPQRPPQQQGPYGNGGNGGNGGYWNNNGGYR